MHYCHWLLFQRSFCMKYDQRIARGSLFVVRIYAFDTNRIHKMGQLFTVLHRHPHRSEDLNLRTFSIVGRKMFLKRKKPNLSFKMHRHFHMCTVYFRHINSHTITWLMVNRLQERKNNNWTGHMPPSMQLKLKDNTNWLRSIDKQRQFMKLVPNAPSHRTIGFIYKSVDLLCLLAYKQSGFSTFPFWGDPIYSTYEFKVV